MSTAHPRPAEAAAPRRPSSMASTVATMVTVTSSGQTTTRPVNVVHPRGTAAPAEVVHHCGATCGRP